MNKHLETLHSLVLAPEDVSRTGPVLAAIASDPGALQDFFRTYLSAYGDSAERGPRQAAGNFVSLIPHDVARRDSRSFDFGVSLHQPGDVLTITSLTAYTTLVSLNATFQVDFYSLPERWNPEVFDPTLELVRNRTEECSRGEVLVLTPGREACQFRFSSPTLILKVQSLPTVPFEWSFDVRTGKAWQCLPALLEDSNAEYSCIRAQALRDISLEPGLRRMLEHPRHFVRWAAARALGMLGFEQGVRALRSLATDPHPHVARAVAREFSASDHSRS